MKTTAERWWVVVNRLGQYRVFDCELEAHCWASRIGYGARVWET